MSDEGNGGPADAFSGPVPMPRFRFFLGHAATPDPSSEEERMRAASRVSAMVSERFNVIGTMHDQAGVYIKVIFDPKSGSRNFETLRRDLKRIRMFPRLVDTGKETIIAVFPLPPRKKGKVTANVVMLVLTIITTVWAGSLIWMSRSEDVLSATQLIGGLISPIDMLMGALTFALPLLLILGTHELGHYFTSKKYGIDATLPYFIPIPPFISPFGTFGALISMKEPISNKKALVDIGAAGPIAGFMIALPVTVMGLVLTSIFPTSSALVEGEKYLVINPPILFDLLSSITGTAGDSMLFPTALAGWIGLFVTALNLFPVGQLDGGHIARGVLGDKAKYLSYATIAVMIVLGFVTSFTTYLLFAVLILFMGGRHPPPLDDVTPIKKRQLMVAGVSVLIMGLTFHPVPIQTYTHWTSEVSFEGVELEHFASPEVPDLIELNLVNEGGSRTTVDLEVWINGTKASHRLIGTEFGWDPSAYSALVALSNSSVGREGFHILFMDPSKLELEGGGRATVSLVAGCSRDVGMDASVKVEIRAVKGGKALSQVEFLLVRSALSLEISIVTDQWPVYELRGEALLLENDIGPTQVVLRAEEGSELNATVLFKKGEANGTWELPTDDGWVEVALSPGGSVAGSINWSLSTDVPRAIFQLAIEFPAGAPSGDRMVLSLSLVRSGGRPFSRTVALPP